MEKIIKWDKETFTYLNSMGLEQYDQFWLIITNFATWTPLYILLIILVFKKYTRREAGLILLCGSAMMIALHFLIVYVKNTVQRIRPNNDETLSELIRVVHNPDNFSFFSGHASSSFAVATFGVLLLRHKVKWIQLLWIFPIMVSFSRIYLGVHFPVDIIIGTLVGMLFAYIFYGLFQKFRAPYTA